MANNQLVKAGEAAIRLAKLESCGISIDVVRSEGSDVLSFAVNANGIPVGGGTMSDEGLSPEEVMLKISELIPLDAITRMYCR